MTLKIGLSMLVLALGAWAGAVPVRTVDDKTGNITIVDKATGQKIFVQRQKIIFVSINKRWEKALKGNERYDNVVVGRNNLVALISSGHGTFIKSYGFDGKLKWEQKYDISIQEFEFGKLYNNSFLEFEYSFGEPSYYITGLMDVENGKSTSFSGEIKIAKGNTLLLHTLGAWVIADKEEAINSFKEANYFTIDLSGDKMSQVNFYTPPRKNCGNYLPESYEKIDFHLNDPQSEEDAKIDEYRKNILRGEYIYAHRADHCGKFTYRFHWTDPKNSGPVILKGWQ